MKTLTLAEVLAGAERAAKRVKRWPQWMKDLSPSTREVTPREHLRKSLEENRKRVAEWTPRMRQAIDTSRVFNVQKEETMKTPYEKAIAICEAASRAQKVKGRLLSGDEIMGHEAFARTFPPEVVIEMLQWMVSSRAIHRNYTCEPDDQDDLLVQSCDALMRKIGGGN